MTFALASWRSLVRWLVVLALSGCRFEDGAVVPESLILETLAEVCPGVRVDERCACRGATADVEKFGPTAECKATVNAWVTGAREAGLEYSRSCTERLFDLNYEFELDYDLDSDALGSCGVDADYALGWLDCADECQIFFGSAAEGEACERFGRRMSTCSGELTCGLDGRCHQPCHAPLEIPQGGVCGYAVGLLREQCAPGRACDAVTQTCAAEPPADAACDPTTPEPFCLASDWCSQETATCMPRLGLGEACEHHAECESLVCDGVCQAAGAFRCDHHWF